MARTAHIAVSGLGLALLAGSGCPLGTAAFSVAPSQSQSLSAPQRHMSASATRLYNVPPPSMDDKEAVQETSDREQPPASFFELQENSARAAQLALDDGHTLIEVEFPPLPASVLEMDDVSAYEVAKANLNLATDFAKSFAAKGKKVAILFPDEAEARIGIENRGTDTPYPNVSISSLRKSDPEDDRVFKPDQLFLNLLGSGSNGAVKPVEDTDMYIIIVASAQELPDVEELEQMEPGKPIVFYNLKLDVLRGDLGAPAFPSKEFQDRFLSRVKPVYYLRTRQYSRSTAKPPFMVNYQGCLFRSYPGEFQTLIDTNNGRYRRVVGNKVRPALGGFKEELTEELKRLGVIEKENKTLNFLRTGYKTTTWWEEEREGASDAWRT